jgi:hypothetical protein
MPANAAQACLTRIPSMALYFISGTTGLETV